MELGISTDGAIGLALALAGAGLVTGFLSGLLGIGGGGILVPVLYETFGVIGVDPSIRMHLSLGTSLLIIAPTSYRTFVAHNARGVVEPAVLRRIIPWIVVGVGLGLVTASYVTSGALKAIWAVLGAALALKLLLGRADWRLGDELPKGPGVEVYAIAVGLISTLMSIGGAIYVVMLMTLYGRPLLNSVATASGIGPAIAIPGMIGFMVIGWGHPGLPPLSLGFVSLLGAALMIPMSLLASPLGVRVAHGISKRSLELAFAAFLLLVSFRFAASLLLS